MKNSRLILDYELRCLCGCTLPVGTVADLVTGTHVVVGSETHLVYWEHLINGTFRPENPAMELRALVQAVADSPAPIPQGVLCQGAQRQEDRRLREEAKRRAAKERRRLRRLDGTDYRTKKKLDEADYRNISEAIARGLLL